MLLDPNGRPIVSSPKTPGAEDPAPQPRATARDFFTRAHKRVKTAMDGGAVTFGDTAQTRLVELVSDLYGSLLVARDGEGREVSLLGADLTDADAARAVSVVAAHMRAIADEIDPSGAEGRPSVERSRAGVLDALSKAGWDGPWDGEDGPQIRARSLLIWSTLARSLLGAVLSNPGAPPPIVKELVMLLSEVQLLAAGNLAALEHDDEHDDERDDERDDRDE